MSVYANRREHYLVDLAQQLLKRETEASKVTGWLSVGKTVIGSVIKHFPNFVLKRLYPETRVVDSIEFDLRSSSGFLVMVMSGIPVIKVFARISNFLPFDVSVERSTLDIWFGQPTAKITSLEPIRIAPYSAQHHVAFECNLSDAEFRLAQQFLALEPSSVALYINATLTLDCGFAQYTKRVSLERRGHDLAGIARYVAPKPVPSEEPV